MAMAIIAELVDEKTKEMAYPLLAEPQQYSSLSFPDYHEECLSL